MRSCTIDAHDLNLFYKNLKLANADPAVEFLN